MKLINPAMNSHLRLFEQNYEELDQPPGRQPIRLLDLIRYDRILVMSSGGKDSGAIVLMLLKMGVPREKIELWHQSVDGGPNDRSFFDWPVTEAYTRAFAKALGIRLEFQWRRGGIRSELLRENATSQAVEYIRAGIKTHLPTVAGRLNTRRRWPAKSANLLTRWCSGIVKVDVFRRVLCNEQEFKQGTYLVLTGERREESTARARYLESERDHGNTKKRTVHRWRPVIDWPEPRIWDIFEEFGIQPHPAYYLGFSRVSCMTCIFCGPDHWATIREIDPERFRMMVEMERELGHKVDAKLTLIETADKGKSLLDKYPHAAKWVAKALTCDFKLEDIRTKNWTLPAGAYGGPGGGPS